MWTRLQETPQMFSRYVTNWEMVGSLRSFGVISLLVFCLVSDASLAPLLKCMFKKCDFANHICTLTKFKSSFDYRKRIFSLKMRAWSLVGVVSFILIYHGKNFICWERGQLVCILTISRTHWILCRCLTVHVSRQKLFDCVWPKSHKYTYYFINGSVAGYIPPASDMSLLHLAVTNTTGANPSVRGLNTKVLAAQHAHISN